MTPSRLHPSSDAPQYPRLLALDMADSPIAHRHRTTRKPPLSPTLANSPCAFLLFFLITGLLTLVILSISSYVLNRVLQPFWGHQLFGTGITLARYYKVSTSIVLFCLGYLLSGFHAYCARRVASTNSRTPDHAAARYRRASKPRRLFVVPPILPNPLRFTSRLPRAAHFRSIPTRSNIHTQKGISLVETLMAALIISVSLIIAAQHFVVNATLLGLNARQRLAEAESVSAISKAISLKQADSTGSLVVNADTTITVGSLQSGYYDYVVGPDPMSSTTPALPTGCGAWPCAIDPSSQPTGSKVVFVRAWTVLTVDAPHAMRSITSAVFPGTVLDQGGGTQPAIATRQTRATYH